MTIAVHSDVTVVPFITYQPESGIDVGGIDTGGNRPQKYGLKVPFHHFLQFYSLTPGDVFKFFEDEISEKYLDVKTFPQIT
jgi:hypothetical protein